ncbi:lymphocyte antigen 6S-like, partial [Poeciliopsis prolifica]|uniref:lymphocyte antigen 6S-like n=1 Tax=Poeciliopsis prolifica TaxID=188132 RepID=UPI0024138BC9
TVVRPRPFLHESEMCHDFSVNNGDYRVAQKTSCCSGDLCNAQINNTKPVFKSNGRRCFSCDGENCMKTVSCAGDENYCVKATGNLQGVSLMSKGCASELICSDQFSSLLKQSTSEIPGYFTGPKISCCEGDYCNSASSASPILMLLLVPLLFSALFS